MDPDEQGVTGEIDGPSRFDPEYVQGLDVSPDENDDRRGGDRVLDQDGRAGGEPAQRSERATGEAVARARDRQRRRKLGEAEHHARVHDGHEDRGDEQPAPAALRQPEVPTREVARDDVRDPQTGEQDPARRPALQLTPGHVGLAGALVLRAVDLPSTPAGHVRTSEFRPAAPGYGSSDRPLARLSPCPEGLSTAVQERLLGTL